MKRTTLFALLLSVPLLFGLPCHAQLSFELTCPLSATGELTRPLPFSVTYNPTTNKYRANWCVDSLGTAYWNGNVVVTGLFPLLAPVGTAAAPPYSYAAEPGLGWRRSNTGTIDMNFLGGTSFRFDGNNQLISLFGATPAQCWNTEICLTSNGSGVMRLGTTVTNNNGRLELGELNIAQLCSVNSVSPAACGTTTTGNIVIPTTTTAYTVNTTKVPSNGRIFLQPSTNSAAFAGSPTCVTPSAGPVTVTAIVGLTSFSIALPSTAGQTCWYWWVVS